MKPGIHCLIILGQQYMKVKNIRNSTTPYHCVARLEVKSATNKLITASSIKEKLMCLKEKYRIQEEQMQGNNPSNGIETNFLQ